MKKSYKFISTALVFCLLFSLVTLPSAHADDASAGMTIAGKEIYVEVDENMSMTVYRVETDGSHTQMTHKPEPIVPTALNGAAQTAWADKLPWSVGTGTNNTSFNNGSAKLLSDKSGYVTTGTRSDGSAGDEVAYEFSATGSVYEANVQTYFGLGDRLTVTGTNESLNLTRILIIETSVRNPGVVSVTTKYRNESDEPISIARFVENNYKIYDPLPPERFIANKREAGLWTQQGATLVWGMDYVMPMYSTMGLRGTSAINALRCASNDLVSRNNWFWGEQGGLPFNDFWGETVGIIVGSAMPYMVRGMEIPTRGSAITDANDTAYTWVGFPGQTIAAGELTDVGTSIVGVHTGDNYQGSRLFEQAMSFIPNLVINGVEVAEDWFASPDPANYDEDAWGNTWESWGGGESFDPIEAINFVNDGTFAAWGIKYVVLDACWYPRGTSGGVPLETAQKNGEGGYIAIPSKWATVAAYFGMPNETEEDTKAVVRAWNDFMHENGFKTAAWCMPMSVYLHPGNDTGWSSAVAGSGAVVSGRNIAIDTPFTLAHPDYLITANAVEYDPETGALLPDQERPLYKRQTGYYPQNGTAELCLGNPRVLEEYTDYFCNLMFAEYAFDGLKIDTQWGTQQCMAIGHGHDDNPDAGFENYALYWKTIYDKAKEILGEDPWMKHCQCGTMMNFFTQNGTNRPITGDPGSSNVRKARYSIRMWKGLYGDNAPAVSDHLENFARRAKSMMGAGYVMETKFWPTGNNSNTLTNEQCLKYFPLAVEEGLSQGYYMDEYKFGFDYPEALAYDRPDKATTYYSFFASSAPVASFTSGSAYTGGGETTMTYSGDMELRGLIPGATYHVTDYADGTFDQVLTADANGIITINASFTESFLLKAELSTVLANLLAPAVGHIDDTLAYTISMQGLKDVLNLTFTFEVDGAMLSGKGLELADGFTALDLSGGASDGIRWKSKGNNLWEGTMTLLYLGGDGFTSGAAFDIAKVLYAAKQYGDATMTLTGLEVVGIDGNDDVVFLDSAIGTAAATIAVVKVYSIYDLNHDEVIDARDLGIAQRYYQAKVGDANWEAAKIADVNSDGRVDMLDFIDIYLNYSAR